jgi:hypothetical protein
VACTPWRAPEKVGSRGAGERGHGRCIPLTRSESTFTSGELPKMKKLSRLLPVVALLASSSAFATPSTVFWTPATTYVQPYAVPHITYDTYVAEKKGFQNDYGLTLGILPFEKLQAEIGVDSFMPGLQSASLLLNGKIGIPENALGDGIPGLSAGVFGVGFKSGISDYNILHAEIGKTFGALGNVTVGGYYGVGLDLLGSDGNKTQGGFIGSYTSPDINLNLPGLNKIVLMADIQTGKNAFGAVGGGIGLYFTPSIDILTGPVFFFDSSATTQIAAPAPARFAGGNPDWLWTVQLDVDFDLRPAKPAATPAATPAAAAPSAEPTKS